MLTAVFVMITATADVQLVSPTMQQWYASHLPQIDDPFSQDVLSDPDLIWYDSRVMPPAYQFRRAVHSPAYDISGGRDAFRIGNANREFPWHLPGGTRAGDQTRTAKFLLLPRGNGDQPLPIVWYDKGTHYAWIFPVGTVLGEVLYMADGDDFLPFELRLRIREESDWGVDIYRPFAHQAAFVAALAEHGQIDLADQVSRGENYRIRYTGGRLNTGFDRTATLQQLPAMPSDVVRSLLSETVFTSAVGDQWSPDSDGPTSISSFSLVPRGYFGGHLGTDRESCRGCHEHTLRLARDFNRPREWYGRVRGSDGILSFHPFDPASISPNGFDRTVRIRQAFVDTGVVTRFDPQTHQPPLYRKSVFPN